MQTAGFKKKLKSENMHLRPVLFLKVAFLFVMLRLIEFMWLSKTWQNKGLYFRN